MRPGSNMNCDFGHVIWDALSHFESLIIEQRIKVIFNGKIQAIALFTYFHRISASHYTPKSPVHTKYM
jgi:hypothetical protein